MDACPDPLRLFGVVCTNVSANDDASVKLHVVNRHLEDASAD